jgi:DNA invertase Pin-like site-specific DNA recombinase
MQAAIYARVSTADQDLDRQLHEAREHLDANYPEVESIDEYADIISGADETGGEEYQRLWDAIAADDGYDVVVVHEISRLSRLGPTEIHEFIQHCLEHQTGVESLDVGLSIRVDDPDLQQTIYTMIANIMGDLAKIEHQQKLERINSGIRSAQRAGKWTGRPPRGFYAGDDKRLHVDPEEFLNVRHALERIERGDSKRQVAKESGIPRSTLTNLYDNQRAFYVDGETDDDRKDAALNDVRPLPEFQQENHNRDDLDEHIRAVVREELGE